jgi:hypothetical protein
MFSEVLQPALALDRQLDHAPVEKVDAAALAQRIDERGWPQHAMLRVVPACEHLQAFDLPRRQLDLRLEVRLELALLQADAHLLEREARLGWRLSEARQWRVVLEHRLERHGGDRAGDGAEELDAEGFGQRLDGEQ